MNKPKFITFTGADDLTSIEKMQDLSKEYPIEWGILYGSNTGGRFPSSPSLFFDKGLTLSLHCCGKRTRAILNGQFEEFKSFKGQFSRIQVNARSRDYDLDILKKFEEFIGIPVIIQVRAQFSNIDFQMLFDQSGGHGLEAKSWPMNPNKKFVGYAGGIGPENVKTVLETIVPTNEFWIDMESKVRLDDIFNLTLCELVCRKVYN